MNFLNISDIKKNNFLKFLGFGLLYFCANPVNALQTHRLNYTHQAGLATNSTLTADVTFDETVTSGSNTAFQDYGLGNGTSFYDFVTAITFTWDEDGNAGGEQTFNRSDYTGLKYVISVDPKTDLNYLGNLKSQLSDLRFSSETGPTNESGANSEFRMTFNDNEYLLSSTTYLPGPIPILGIGAAFSYSRKLKKKIKEIRS